MDRHVFLAVPWNGTGEQSPTLTVYYDINSGHYDCEIDNELAGTVTQDENKRWVDAKTGKPSEFSEKAGSFIEEQLAVS